MSYQELRSDYIRLLLSKKQEALVKHFFLQQVYHSEYISKLGDLNGLDKILINRKIALEKLMLVNYT
jgi:hypothetical protein